MISSISLTDSCQKNTMKWTMKEFAMLSRNQNCTYLSTSELVVPAENTIIRATPEGSSMLSNARSSGQLKVGGVPSGIVQPSTTPNKLIPVTRGVVEKGRVRASRAVPAPLFPAILEECPGTMNKLLRVGLAVLEDNGSSCQSCCHLSGKVWATMAFIDWSRIVYVLWFHPAIMIIWCWTFWSVS